MAGGDSAGDEEDPLGLFASGPLQARAPCIGRWRTDGLDATVRFCSEPVALIMEVGSKELVLTEITAFKKWSAAAASTPEAELYVASVSGYGPSTKLTLQPGSKHEGNSKTTLLSRVEHIEDGSAKAENGAAARATLTRGPGAESRDDEPPQAQERRKSPGLLRSLSGSRSRGRGRGRPSCSRSYSGSRSRSGSRSPRRRGGGGRGKGKGGGDGKGKDGEEITTLFVTGLPEDAKESEIIEDFEEAVGKVERVVMMRRSGELSAFVRFNTMGEVQKAMDKVMSGRLKVCDSKCKAEVARRNTN